MFNSPLIDITDRERHPDDDQSQTMTDKVCEEEFIVQCDKILQKKLTIIV